MPLEDFFLAYGKQDRAPGEFVESVRIPRPSPDMLVRIVKLSKRFDSDISGVCGAFALRIEDGIVTRGARRLRRHGRHSRPRARLRGGADRPGLDRGDGRGRRRGARRRLSRRSTTCAARPPIAAPPPPICCAASGPSATSPSACSMADRTASRRPRGAVNQPLPHDSAELHVAGAALYVDDLPEAPGTLHLAFGLAADGHARLTGLDLDRGPRRAGRGRGLHRRRHPRREQCRPGLPRRPALRRGRDPLPRPALVRRRRDQQPRRARRRAAGAGRNRAASRPRHHRRGARGGLPTSSRRSSWRAATPRPRSTRAPHRLAGTLEMGGQEHFYLEGQAALATPGEAGQIHVVSSTQHPSEVQHLIAALLGLTQRRRDGRGPPDGRRRSAARRPRPPLMPPPARWSPRRPAARPRSAPTATTTWS